MSARSTFSIMVALVGVIEYATSKVNGKLVLPFFLYKG